MFPQSKDHLNSHKSFTKFCRSLERLKLRLSEDPFYSVFGSSDRRASIARATDIALERTAFTRGKQYRSTCLYGPRPGETIPWLMIIWPLSGGNNTIVYT
ncbi:hypothetical protein CsSME_00045972 [Camellia sinensis var. sinensis]